MDATTVAAINVSTGVALAAGGVIAAAYGAIWCVKTVIGVFKK